ncbi:nucleotidyl transferase AbiEii/AbiGii toxin family protein [Candidatus Pacearchaeota archaeon]|nr:nucleotidyl transferase AbiEii/AbiGii toxin family protein [Candidatus Pacearchaeota archaeon]
MGKLALYDILDGEYCFLLDRVTRIFKEKGLNPAIVGGAAVQVHAANLLSQTYNRSIEDLFAEGELRQQDHIRSTDDIDIAVLDKELLMKNQTEYKNKIMSAIQEIPVKDIESSDKNDLYDISIERMGLRRPIIHVRSFNKGSRISFNISNSPTDLYHLGQTQYVSMIENAQDIVLNYGSDFSPVIRVYQLADVIATKLSACRAKDIFDIINLRECAKRAGKEIDRKRLVEILGDTPEGMEKIDDFFAGRMKIG